MPLEQRVKFMSDTNANKESMVIDLMSVLTLLQRSFEAGTPLPAVLPNPLMAKALLRHLHIRSDRLKKEVMEQLASQNGRHSISALNAYMRLLSSVDDLVMVIKRSVGEQNLGDLTFFGEEESKV